MRYYVKNICPACGENFDFLQEEIGREHACPHCGKPVLLKESRPVWLRLSSTPWNTSGVRRIAILAGASFCGGIIIHFAARRSFTGVILMDLAGLVGTAFLPFAVAMLVEVLIKG